MFHLLGAEYLHKLFRILLHRRFVYSSPFIYSIFYFFQYGLVNICFMFWVTILMLLYYLLLRLFQFWPLGALSRDFSVPLMYPIIVGFLTSDIQDAPDSSCVFTLPALESTISWNSPGSIYWRILLEIKIWVLGIPVDTWVFSHFFDSILKTNKTIYVYI